MQLVLCLMHNCDYWLFSVVVDEYENTLLDHPISVTLDASGILDCG